MSSFKIKERALLRGALKHAPTLPTVRREAHDGVARHMHP